MRWIPILATLTLLGCQSDSAQDTATTDGRHQSDDVSAANLDGHTEPPTCAPANGQQCVVGQPIMDFSLSDCTGKKWNAQELLRNHQRRSYTSQRGGLIQSSSTRSVNYRAGMKNLEATS